MKRALLFSLVIICFISLLLSGCVLEKAKPLAPPLLPPGFEDSEVPNVNLDGYFFLNQGTPFPPLQCEYKGVSWLMWPFVSGKVNRALVCLSPNDSSEAPWAKIAYDSSQQAQALHQAIPEFQGLWKFCQGSDFFFVYGQGAGAQSLVSATTQNDFVLFKNAYPDTYKIMDRLPTNPPGKAIGAGFIRPSTDFNNWLLEITGDDEIVREIIDTLEKAKIQEIVIGAYSKRDFKWEEEPEKLGLSALFIGKSSYPGLVISQVLPRIGLTEDYIDDEKIYVATFDGVQVAIKSVGGYIYISVAPKLKEAKYLLRTALAKLDLVSLPEELEKPSEFWAEVENPSADGANIFVEPELAYKRIPAHFAFSKDLQKGMDCEDVKYLQIILNSDPHTCLAESGPGSPDHETSYFGDLTKKAVIKFQKKYGIISSEDNPGAGHVGPKTRAKLNELLGIRKHAPNDWVLYVANTHRDKEIYDGYIWWEVKDVTDGTEGWAASKHLRYEESKQQEWKEKTKKIMFLRDVPSNFVFNRDLSVGTKGDDVVYLQIILNADPDTQVAESGPGSPGSETRVFASLTEKAVKKFQCKYGIVCSGSPETTGYGRIGPKPRAKLNELLGDKEFKAKLEDKYELKKGRISVAREAIEQFLGKDGFPPANFPVELILAMAAQESDFDNEVNEDGLMQVTEASGCHRDGLYSNTRQGIYANAEDGLKVLKGFYEYSKKDVIGAVWRYNGGRDPYSTYKEGKGDRYYLEHVAEKYVEYGFGDKNSKWYKLLIEAQEKINSDVFTGGR